MFKLNHVGKLEAQKGVMVVLITYPHAERGPVWAYVAGRPDQCFKLVGDIRAGKSFELESFHIIREGDGPEPPMEVKKEMFKEYRVAVIPDDVLKEKLKDYLAE